MIKLASDNRYGGIQILNGKIATDQTFHTIIFIALFGGNIDQNSSPSKNKKGEESKDYFGNLYQFERGLVPFNSSLERTLRDIPIMSGSIQKYESAILEDLKFMIDKKMVKSILPSVSIKGANDLTIGITVTKPDGTPENYSYLWSRK